MSNHDHETEASELRAEISRLTIRLAESQKALVIANARLADMEFLSIEGFISWKEDIRSQLKSRGDGEHD